MELRQLEIFLAVIETGSVTRAAQKMFLTPGAVSLQIHHLAAELATDLFARRGKHLVPTPAAMRLAAHADQLLTQVRRVRQEFAADPRSDTNPFHFATGATSLIHRLPKALRQLRKQLPSASIHITVSATEEMVEGLHARRFDLALISLPYPEEGLSIMPLYDEELLVLRPAATRVRGWHVGTITVAELKNLPFLLYPKRSNMRTMIQGFFDDLRIQPRVLMEADDTESIKGLVEAGLGCSILPEFALRGRPRFFQVYRVTDRPLFRRQALAMPKSDRPRMLTMAVARFLQNALVTGSRKGADE